MAHNNVRLTSLRSYIAAAAITKGMVCKPTSAAETVTPCTLAADIAACVAEEDVASGARGTFRTFNSVEEQRVLIAANITRGAKVAIDPSNAGKIITRASGIGIGVALESGTTGATILVQPGFTET